MPKIAVSVSPRKDVRMLTIIVTDNPAYHGNGVISFDRPPDCLERLIAWMDKAVADAGA